MSASKVQLIGGNFQDSEGNVLSNGYLLLTLNQDTSITGVGLIGSLVDVKITLNSSGSVDTGTVQSVWGNDQMLPANTYYEVRGFKSNGQPAWGPNYQQVIGSGGTFDVGTWVPNQLVNWNPPLQTPALETNGTLNANQNVLNLKQGSNVTLTNDSTGTTIAASAPAGTNFQVAGGNVTSQTTINFESTDGSVSISNPSAGNINFTSSSSGFASGSFLWSYQTLITFGGTFTSAAPGPDTSTNNAVLALYLEIIFPITINHISTIMASLNGGVIGFAIYDKTGNTKVLDAGTNAFNGGSIGVQTVNLGSPFTLQKGQYWAASAASVANNSLAMGWQIGGSSYTNVVNTRLASAANSMSSGVMPSSLGTLTPIRNTTIPGFLLNG